MDAATFLGALAGDHALDVATPGRGRASCRAGRRAGAGASAPPPPPASSSGAARATPAASR